MYTPSRFAQPDETKIFDLIRHNPFAVLVSHDGEKPIATHVPVEAERTADGKLILHGHIARANPQWQTFDPNKEILAIFSGAHSYISPRWYDAPLENVPTWNYSAVHVYGKPEIVADEDGLFAIVKRLVDRYENGTDYAIERVAPDYVEKLLKAIVGFRLEAARIEASFKLSQHHRQFPHYANVIAELERQGDENSLAVAAAMRENL